MVVETAIKRRNSGLIVGADRMSEQEPFAASPGAEFEGQGLRVVRILDLLEPAAQRRRGQAAMSLCVSSHQSRRFGERRNGVTVS
jgi:hypothetical protein